MICGYENYVFARIKTLHIHSRKDWGKVDRILLIGADIDRIRKSRSNESMKTWNITN